MVSREELTIRKAFLLALILDTNDLIMMFSHFLRVLMEMVDVSLVCYVKSQLFNHIEVTT